MRTREREREQGRGERVLPGLWRLRLPIGLPGVPHGNAWAIAAGDGIVLVDTGIYDAGSMDQLELALGQVGLAVEQITQLVITHVHPDHFGQAAPIVQHAGCRLWMHPAHASAYARYRAGEDDLTRRLEIGRRCGIPEETLELYAETAKRSPPRYAELIEPDRELVTGVRLETDLGVWEVHETPGHARSHVCLHQRDQRLLISGDHLLGRVSAMYLEHGDDPDPVVSFEASLELVAGLRARLALSGHGRPFLDVPGHISATQELLRRRLTETEQALAATPGTAMELAAVVLAGDVRMNRPVLALTQILVLLEHLERTGRARRDSDGEHEFWSAAERPAAPAS